MSLGTAETVALPRVETNIPGLDHILLGGFPRGRVVVVAGPAGSAKTVLAGQFLAGGAGTGHPGVFVTLEERSEELRHNFATLGFDIARWEESSDWCFVDGSPRYDSNLDEVADVHVETLLAQIGQALDRTGASRVVIDSYAAAGFDREDRLTRSRLRGLLAELRRLGATVVLTVETDEQGDSSLTSGGAEQYVADTVLVLRNALEGESRRRTVEVLKMRGAPHRRGQFGFTVVPGQGVVVLPLGGAQELDQGSTETRVTSGNLAVDKLCGGGFFRDSIVLVSGPTGIGKTLMVTEFVAGGDDPGKKALLFSFEESRDQLQRNARGWGYDLQAAEEAGRLKVISTYPQVATLEDHLVAIKQAVEEFAPERIAVDSLSALERVGSQTSFREFVIGLTSFVKARQTVGLFTASTDELLGGSSLTETHISMLTDSIVVLRYVEVFGTVKRAITVLKMRGSDHDREVREYRIDGSGLHVGEPFRTVAGILTGDVVNLVALDQSTEGGLPPPAFQ
jgi:circadian clock protein KaiC